MKQLRPILIKWIIIGISVILIDAGYIEPPNTSTIEVIQKASITPVRGINYELTAPLIVKVDMIKYVVPAGYVTDLASIPRWLWGIIAPSEGYLVMPAILHDYLYSCPAQLSRREADDIFYSFLVANQVSEFKAFQMYLAVRVFGSNHFYADKTCLYFTEQPHEPA